MCVFDPFHNLMVTVLLAFKGFIFLLWQPILFCSVRSFSKITVATGDDDAYAGSAADKGNATGLTLSDDVD